MSPSSEATVRLPADLHARPAGQLARAAAGFTSSVSIGAGDRHVDARSVLLVMSLGAVKDSDVTIRATGEDAEQAVRELSGILAAARPVDAASG